MQSSLQRSVHFLTNGYSCWFTHFTSVEHQEDYCPLLGKGTRISRGRLKLPTCFLLCEPWISQLHSYTWHHELDNIHNRIRHSIRRKCRTQISTTQDTLSQREMIHNTRTHMVMRKKGTSTYQMECDQ